MSARCTMSLVLLFAAALSGPAAATATTLRLPTVESLARDADAVLRARVRRVGSRARRTTDGIRMEFEAELDVVAVWAGHDPGPRVRVGLEGGRYPGGAHVVHGAPVLREGEEVVLFLRPGPAGGAPRVLGMALGVFRVVADGARVQREVSDAEVVGRTGPFHEELSMDELRRRVREAREIGAATASGEGQGGAP